MALLIAPMQQEARCEPPAICLLYCIDGYECRFGPCRPRVVNLGPWNPVPYEYEWPKNDFPPAPDPAPMNHTFSAPGSEP